MANKVIEYAKRNPGKTTLAVGVGVVLMVMVIGGRKNPDTENATGVIRSMVLAHILRA